jgi:hypothetical protein
MFIYVLIFILTQGYGFIEDLSLHERYLENVQRLARLEEGQKTIIEKLEDVDQRFDSVKHDKSYCGLRFSCVFIQNFLYVEPSILSGRFQRKEYKTWRTLCSPSFNN